VKACSEDDEEDNGEREQERGPLLSAAVRAEERGNVLRLAVDIRCIPSEPEDGDNCQHYENHAGERSETRGPAIPLARARAHVGLPSVTELRRPRRAMPATPR
jgi:hypothetical protein